MVDAKADYVMIEWLWIDKDVPPVGQQYYVSNDYRFNRFLEFHGIAYWESERGGMFANIKTMDDLIALAMKPASYDDFMPVWEFLDCMAEGDDIDNDQVIADGGVPNHLVFRIPLDMENGDGCFILEEDEAKLEGVRICKIVRHVTDTVRLHSRECWIRDGSCDCKRLAEEAEAKAEAEEIAELAEAIEAAERGCKRARADV
jgi:hypothetical protein